MTVAGSSPIRRSTAVRSSPATSTKLPSPEKGAVRGAAAVGAGGVLALAGGWLSAERSPLIVGGTIAGLTVGALALRRALFAVALLLAVIALLPFGVVPLRFGVAPTLLDLATALVLLVWAARAATGRSPARVTGVGVALALFCAALMVSYVFSPERLAPDETARTFAKLIAAHLLFVPVFNLVDRPERVRRVAAWLIVIGTFEALVGLALYVVPRSLALRALSALGVVGYPTGDAVLRYRPDTEILRAIGTSVDPNMLGALLLVTGALVGGQLVAERPRVPRWWLTLAAGPIALCLLLSESRGAWLGLGGGLLLTVGLRYRRLWAGAAAVAALAALTPAAQRFTAHLFSGLRAQDRAASMRLGEIENALTVMERYPLFGAGWGQGGQSVELEFTLGVSNIFLTVGQRAGVPAMLLYLGCWAALATLLWPAFRARLRATSSTPDDGLFLGLSGALVGAAIAGMVDHHFVRFPHLVSLVWVTAALALTLRAET